MATNLTAFIDEIRPEVPLCPAVVMKSKLIKTIQEFCKKTQLLKYSFEYSVLTTDVDASDNDSVDVDLSALFPTYSPVKVRYYKEDDLEYTPEHLLVGSDLADFEDNYDIAATKFYNFSGTQIIKFFPFDISATTTLFLEVVFKPLDTATTVDDFFYNDWLECLRDGALWRIMDMTGTPWTDKQEAMKRWSFFKSNTGRASIGQKSKEQERGRPKRMAMDF